MIAEVLVLPSSLKLPVEAETSCNSLSWTILHGTSLFSRFYGATISVSSRKQGICLQNMGGGGEVPALPRYPDQLHRECGKNLVDDQICFLVPVP
jgi:hypothetical protein